MSWTYEQLTGNLYDPSGAFIHSGYAGGDCGKNPQGVNNPAAQMIDRTGPLPEGMYTKGTPVEGTALGAFAIPLIPDPANEMFGRGGFYIHGDNPHMNESASEGCIVMPPIIRHAFYSSPDPNLQVVAEIGAVI